MVINPRNRYIKSGELLTIRKDVLQMADPKAGSRNLPSAYQQILANMRVLEDRVLPMVEKLEQTIFNPDWEDPSKPQRPSDVVMDIDENTMKVIGISVVVTNKDKDLRPADYIRDITYELKQVEVLGLTGRDGITLDYITLMTVRMNSAPEVAYPTWQCAFGDKAMAPYFRASVNDHEWGSWVKVIDLPKLLDQYPEIIKQLSHRQIIDSMEQPGPDDQEVGDYWLQTILPDTGYYFQDLTNMSITKVDKEEMANYSFADAETGEEVETNPDDYELGTPGEETTEEEGD
ncbi:MAG: hypothetical protein NC311_05940 [Muribaculaceae bacterium]|nr:hypothetical protein [Muribaculaceae bacterium]